MAFFLRPQPICEIDESALRSFSSREPDLNAWLTDRARDNELLGYSRTMVIMTASGLVAGYFSLACGQIAHKDVKAVLKRNAPNPIPVALLGRLAVDKNFEGMGLGAAMLKEAILRAQLGAQYYGARYLITFPISISARNFYLHFGFQSPKADGDGEFLIFPLVE